MVGYSDRTLEHACGTEAKGLNDSLSRLSGQLESTLGRSGRSSFQVREPKQWLPTLGAKIGIAKSLSRDDVLGKVVPLGYPNHRSTFSPVEIVAQQRVVGDYPRVRP